MSDKLPVGAVLTQSFQFLRDNIRVAAILFGILALVQSAIAVLYLDPSLAENNALHMKGIVLTIVVALASVPSLTAWYRRAILRPDHNAVADWRIGREEGLLLLAWLRYFGWSFLFALAVSIPMVVIGVAASMAGVGRAELALIVGILGVGALLFGLFYWLFPLTMMLPAAAMAQTLPAKSAIALVRGNRWRFVGANILVGIVTAVVSQIVFKLSLGVAPSIILNGIVNFVALTWGAAVLANCYRFLMERVTAMESAA